MAAPAEKSSTNSRWKLAQQWEQEWWQAHVPAMDPEFYLEYAENVRKDLAPYFQFGSENTILEVGSGGAGIVSGLTGQRYAVDPLEGYYCTVERFQKFRDPAVHYGTARGEELPFPDRMFDLVITDNVLDHCESPDRVMSEIDRVLKPGGILYLRLNVYKSWGRFVRLLAEQLKIDAGHPHTFTQPMLRGVVEKKFSILKEQARSFGVEWRRDLTSGNLKDVLKAFSFATHLRVVFIARKTER